jgi:hypothetical protein
LTPFDAPVIVVAGKERLRQAGIPNPPSFGASASIGDAAARWGQRALP